MKSSPVYIKITAKLGLAYLLCLCIKLNSCTVNNSMNNFMYNSINISEAKNFSDVQISQSPFKPPKREQYYVLLKAEDRTNVSTEVIVKTHKKQLVVKKPVSVSAYQSQVKAAKQKSHKAGSQEALDDATKGHLTKHPKGKPKKLIFCYYGSSANSRPGLGKFWPEHIDPLLCTHLIFAFVDITEDGTDLKPNNWNDLGEKGLYARTLKLKDKNPDLKILLAVGGWKIGSKPFLPVIENKKKWGTWVSNVIAYLRKFKFDGFDMDWEFPSWRGSGPEDKHKFTLLMKDLYEAFDEEAKISSKEKLLLTLAAASSAFYAEKSYEHSEIHKYIDYMLLMTYNYHGSAWEKHTGHHSPLLPHPLDPEGEQRELYILWSVKYWLNFGVPREKIVVGLATYGIGWKLIDGSHTGVKAPASGGTAKGKYTDEAGILSHYEICENVIQDGWKVEWIDEQKVPYAHGNGEWVGFDSPDSFYLKASMIIKENLVGAFVWSLEMDDFNGHCGGPKYPLLRTIYEVFTQSSSSTSLHSLYSPKSASASDNKKALADRGKAQSSTAAKGSHQESKKDHDLKDKSTAPPLDHAVSYTVNHPGDTGYIKDTDGYVKDTDGYFKDTDGYVKDTDGYVKDTDGYVKDTDGYVKDTDGYVKDTDGYVKDTDGYVKDTDGYVKDTDGYVKDTDGYVKDTDGYVKDTDGYVKDTDGYVKDTDGYVKDTDYPSYYIFEDTNIEIGGCNNLGLGIHSDPTSCHHFILCVPVSHHVLGSTRMSCPAGTLFDEKLKVCNHQLSVKCLH